MNARLSLLLFFLTLTSGASAISKYRPTTFVERALARVGTPSILPQAAPVAGNGSISFADPIQLPAANPWNSAAGLHRPVGDDNGLRLQKILGITGGVLLAAGLFTYIFSHAAPGTSNNGSDNSSESLRITAICVAVVGSGLLIAASLISFYNGRYGRRRYFY